MRQRRAKLAGNATENGRKYSNYDLAELEALKVQVNTIQVRLDEIIRTARANPLAKRKSLKAQGRKRGPKQRHRPEIYFERDMFVRLLEQHWLILEPLCGHWADDGLKLAVAPDLKMIRKHLRRWRDDPMAFQMGEVAANLLERSDFLDQFLTTPSMRRSFSGDPRQVNNRFGGNPRQIANALAGVPLVSVWRSLKLCWTKDHVCKVSMPETALPSYIRRKHQLLARALDADQALPLLSAFVRSYPRRNDPHIKNLKAIELQRIWGTLR
jgi:hypothetical protein